VSGDFLPPSPPSKKTTARGDQTWHAGTGDRAIFIIWALLTVPTPTRTPNATNVDRIVLTPTATEANLWDINIARPLNFPAARAFSSLVDTKGIRVRLPY
jgi:hypothetical protein